MRIRQPDPMETGVPAAPTPASRARDWILAFSAANIFYLRTWSAILEKGRNITPTAYLVAVANVVVLAVCFRWAYVHILRSRNKWVRWCGILVAAGLLLIPFHAITTIYFTQDIPKRNAVYAAGLLAAAGIVVSRHFRSLLPHVLMLIAPFVLMTFGQALWQAAAYDGSRWLPPAPVPAAATSGKSRLLWLIFDEWDYGLTFDARPAWLHIPEVDRLNAISFHASQAIPPGSTTDTSMPRLLTGDKNADKQHLSNLPSVFSKAKDEGFQSAVSGFYFDYCGIFSRHLASCWSANMDAERYSMGSHPAEIAANQLRHLFENQFRSPFGQSLGTKRHTLDYGVVLRGALQAASDPAFNLVFVHFPIPHPPYFYDRTTGRFDLNSKLLVSLIKRDPTRYFDAVQLVDRTLEQLRRNLESAGLWDRTHLLISSDHPLKNRYQIDGINNDPRVPFIVRVAGASDEIFYNGPLHTIISGDLILALLRGEVRTPAEVRSRIEQQQTGSVK